MSATKNTALVYLGAVTKDFQKGMEDARRSMSKLSKTSQKVGAAMKQAGAVAGRAFNVASVAVAAAATKMVFDYDNAQAIIQRGTGATKEEMNDLLKVWENVTKEGPESWETTANAVAQAATIMTGSLGEIETATISLLDMGRALGAGDQVAVVEGMARAANLFGVATKDLPAVSDAIYGSLQGTGISIEELMRTMKNYSGVMKGLNFDMVETANVFGQFSKAGAPVKRVIPAFTQFFEKLRQLEGVEGQENIDKWLNKMPAEVRGAFRSFRQEGSEPIVVLRQIQEAIANAEDEATALTLALSVFGTDAGASLAAALRSIEGIELDVDSEDLIAKFSGSLDEVEPTITEKIKEMENNLKMSALPLVLSFVESLEEKFSDEDSRFETIGKGLIGMIIGGMLLGPTGAKLGLIAGMFGNEIETALDKEFNERFGIEQAGGKWANIIVGGLAAGLVFAATKNPKLALAAGTIGSILGDDIVGSFQKSWEEDSEKLVGSIGGGIAGGLLGASVGGPIGAAIGSLVGSVVGQLGVEFKRELEREIFTMDGWLGPALTTAFTSSVFGIAAGIASLLFKELKDEIWSGIKWVWNHVKDAFVWFGNQVVNVLSIAWNETVNAFKIAWSNVSGWFKQYVIDPILFAWQGLTSGMVTAWDAVSGALVTAWNAATGGIKTGINGIRWLWNTVTGGMVTAWNVSTKAITKAWGIVVKAIVKALKWARDKILELVDEIKQRFDWAIGPINAIKSAIDGVRSAAEAALSAIQRLANAPMDTVNNAKKKIGDIPIVGDVVKKIPGLGNLWHTGGTFVPPRGRQEGLAVLQRGEQITPATHTSPNVAGSNRPVQIEVMLDTQVLVHALETYSDNVGPIRIAVR